MSSYDAESDSALQKAINRFAVAVKTKVFEGTIPYGNPDTDPDEAYRLAEIHDEIDKEYARSRSMLEQLITRRVQSIAQEKA